MQFYRINIQMEEKNSDEENVPRGRRIRNREDMEFGAMLSNNPLFSDKFIRWEILILSMPALSFSPSLYYVE